MGDWGGIQICLSTAERIGGRWGLEIKHACHLQKDLVGDGCREQAYLSTAKSIGGRWGGNQVYLSTAKGIGGRGVRLKYICQL